MDVDDLLKFIYSFLNLLSHNLLITVKPGLHKSELYEILDYTSFLPGPGEIPFNPIHLKSELYESELYETRITR